MQRQLDALDRGEPYIMPFLQGKQMIHTIPQGRLSYMLNDLCAGNLPRQLLISFVAHDSFNNNLKKNPYVFENLNIRSLVFKVNGQNSPSFEYRPNFTATPLDCIRGKSNNTKYKKEFQGSKLVKIFSFF